MLNLSPIFKVTRNSPSHLCTLRLDAQNSLFSIALNANGSVVLLSLVLNTKLSLFNGKQSPQGGSSDPRRKYHLRLAQGKVLDASTTAEDVAHPGPTEPPGGR